MEGVAIHNAGTAYTDATKWYPSYFDPITMSRANKNPAKPKTTAEAERELGKALAELKAGAKRYRLAEALANETLGVMQRLRGRSRQEPFDQARQAEAQEALASWRYHQARLFELEMQCDRLFNDCMHFERWLLRLQGREMTGGIRKRLERKRKALYSPLRMEQANGTDTDK